MERRKKPRKDWVVGKDDIGHTVLEWKVDYRVTQREQSDSLARTYDFLKRLDAPDLAIEDESKSSSDGRNPYDTGTDPAKPKRRP